MFEQLTKEEKYKFITQKSEISIGVYRKMEGTFYVYDSNFEIENVFPNYIDRVMHYDLYSNKKGYIQFLEGKEKEFNITLSLDNKEVLRKITKIYDDEEESVIYVKDYSKKDIEIIRRSQLDSLTSLWNREEGEIRVDHYLEAERKYGETFGFIVLDVDYFKSANDIYGHTFGDQVLIQISVLFKQFFNKEDILIRAGGDEFAFLVKHVTYEQLQDKVQKLTNEIGNITFENIDFFITSSIGVCFVDKDNTNEKYDSLFKKADVALYHAKEKGRNQYVFYDCVSIKNEANVIDAKYFHNDIISSAFEIFQRNKNIDSAISILLSLATKRLQLDRISIVDMDIENCIINIEKGYSKDCKYDPYINTTQFSESDFKLFFNLMNKDGYVILQQDKDYGFSSTHTIINPSAKTALLIPTYQEGRFTGLISYISCERKRMFTKKQINELLELTKIISNQISINTQVNRMTYQEYAIEHYDLLSGLISIGKFKEEIEKFIVGGNATGHILVYTDIQNFTFFNQKYGYKIGDKLLKEFAEHVVDSLSNNQNVYFSRVISDHFVLFMPYKKTKEAAVTNVDAINKMFAKKMKEIYPDYEIRLRSGIYFLDETCKHGSIAIDHANYARKCIRQDDPCWSKLYDASLEKQRKEESRIINNVQRAIEEKELDIYFQPKYDVQTKKIAGAEVLLRWLDNGKILTPDVFIPLFEKNGKLIELDYYAFELAMQYIQEHPSLCVPLSINASILHSINKDSANTYIELLQKYNVDPSLVEIELTETETLQDYAGAVSLLTKLQDYGIHTALDDFGAGYSLANTILDIPFNTIKVDGPFFQRCCTSEKGIRFMKGIVQMLKVMDNKVVVEGVETQKQFDIVKEMGCDYVQGYYFSEAVSKEKFEKMMKEV